MIDAAQAFLSHAFGLSIIGLAVVAAGLLAFWMIGRDASRSKARVIAAAAIPMPLVLALLTAVLHAISPWEDPLIGAVLLTVGLFGTVFSLLAGLAAAAIVVRWARS